MKIIILILLVLLALIIFRPGIGFKNQKLEDYADTSPKFDIRERLKGDLICEGVIYGPFGKVVSRFVARMHGSWEGNKGILKESFTYADGSVQERQWNLTVSDDGHFTATAADIIGEGKGQQKGSAVKMNYRLVLPEDAGGHQLDVTDWLYLVDNGTIINRSQMRKFGFKVAELIATIRPASPVLIEQSE